MPGVPGTSGPGHVRGFGPAQIVAADAVATIYADAPSYVSSSTGSLTEAKAGVDAQAGMSGTTGTLVEAKAGVDTGTGTSSTVGSVVEARVAANTITGTSTSAGSLAEARIGAETVNGTSTSSGSTVELRSGTDTCSGTSSSTYSLAESRVAVDAITGLSTSTLTLSEGLSRMFVDLLTGVSSSVGSLVEVSVSGPGGYGDGSYGGGLYARAEVVSVAAEPVPPPSSALIDLLYPPKPQRRGVRYDDVLVGVSNTVGTLDEVHLRAQPRATLHLEVPDDDREMIDELLVLELV